MALHGWAEIAEELSQMVRRDRWDEIARLVDDEMLATFAQVGDEAELPALLSERYRGLTDRLALYIPFRPGERDDFWRSMVAGIRTAG